MGAAQKNSIWHVVFFSLNMTRYGLADLILHTQFTNLGLRFSVPLLTSGKRRL